MALKTVTIKTRTCDSCKAEIQNSYYLNQGVVLGRAWPTNSTCTIEIRDIQGSNGVNVHHPDLCPDCARKILKKLMESLPCASNSPVKEI